MKKSYISYSFQRIHYQILNIPRYCRSCIPSKFHLYLVLHFDLSWRCNRGRLLPTFLIIAENAFHIHTHTQSQTDMQSLLCGTTTKWVKSKTMRTKSKAHLSMAVCPILCGALPSLRHTNIYVCAVQIYMCVCVCIAIIVMSSRRDRRKHVRAWSGSARSDLEKQ